MKIILASNSPRRKELLELAKIDFEIKVANVEEILDPTLPIVKQIEMVAYSKAKPVAEQNRDSLVIGSDTVVVINDEILGKPKDKKDAFRMIKLLQNNTHQVITGVALCYNNEVKLFHEITDVTFYPMTDSEINEYIELPTIYDKAGAYAIQGEAAIYIHSINGDYYNVMGLPIAKLIQHLKKYK